MFSFYYFTFCQKELVTFWKSHDSKYPPTFLSVFQLVLLLFWWWFQFLSLFLILVTYFSSFSILSFLHTQLNQRHIHTLLLLTNFILSFGCNRSILVLIKNKNLKEIMMRYNLQRQIEISRSRNYEFPKLILLVFSFISNSTFCRRNSLKHEI